MKMKDAPGGGGKYLVVDKENFPIISSLATMIVEVKPGAMRELHWHPNVSGLFFSLFMFSEIVAV